MKVEAREKGWSREHTKRGAKHLRDQPLLPHKFIHELLRMNRSLISLELSWLNTMLDKEKRPYEKWAGEFWSKCHPSTI